MVASVAEHGQRGCPSGSRSNNDTTAWGVPRGAPLCLSGSLRGARRADTSHAAPDTRSELFEVGRRVDVPLGCYHHGSREGGTHEA